MDTDPFWVSTCKPLDVWLKHLLFKLDQPGVGLLNFVSDNTRFRIVFLQKKAWVRIYWFRLLPHARFVLFLFVTKGLFQIDVESICNGKQEDEDVG